MKSKLLTPRILLFCLLLSITLVVVGDEAAPESDSGDGIRAALREYVDAFNRRDASAMAAMWQAEGVFVNEESGERITGRAALQQSFETLFGEHADLTLGGQVETIRFIRPDVAQVSGQAVTVGADEERLESTFTATLVHDGKQWLFDSIQERRLPPPGDTEVQLDDLEFLVGEWQDDSDEAQVVSTVRWGANRSFLVRSYTMQREDGESYQGTQVIGWDPRQQRIRCWMFDSAGTFGEGTWASSEAGWTLKFQQTLADGSIAAATQVITIVDADTLLVQLVGPEVEGHMRPSSDPVRVVRVAAPSDE